MTAAQLGVKPEECVFLDDAQENCQGAENAGMKAIKVELGHTEEAVQALQTLLNMKLA